MNAAANRGLEGFLLLTSSCAATRARRFIIAGLVIALLCAVRPAVAQQAATEETITAAFLLNFARFTQWPAAALAPGAPIALCVTDDAVAGALAIAARGRSIDGHRVEVRTVDADAPLASCALLFVGRASSDSLPRVLAGLKGTSVLTVSDAEAFAERGGVIQLYVEGGRMRFAINIQTARAARLSLSAQLLSLARIIGG